MKNAALLSLALALGALSPSLARADVPPPDSCTKVGESCNTAGDKYDQPGTCQASKCQRGSPDGSVTTYDCDRCIAASGKDAGPPVAPAAKSDDGGCAVARGSAPYGFAAAVLALGALGLVARRRRRLY
ncbi:MAG TPA: MYXO-CTERM sorting domain-containing protein [Polyangiaceae bacterium]|nr:MYXO-CTERM sorting domain-containing protein [Polyangiaceae bacterium]